MVVLRQGQALRVSHKISTHSGRILLENLAFKTPNPERMAFFFFLFFSFQNDFEVKDICFFDFLNSIPLFRQRSDFDSDIKRPYSTSINNWVQLLRIKKSHHYDEISKGPVNVFLDYFSFGSLSASSILTAV